MWVRGIPEHNNSQHSQTVAKVLDRCTQADRIEKNGLTHWGRVTHICVGHLTIIGSDNGLSPSRRQAIIWTNTGILLIRPLGTNFNEMLIEIHTFSFKKMHLKMSSAKWRLFCLGLNELMHIMTSWRRFRYCEYFMTGIRRAPVDFPHEVLLI